MAQRTWDGRSGGGRRDQFVGWQEARANAGRRQRSCQRRALLERNREVGIPGRNVMAGILLEEDRGDESPQFGQLFRCRARGQFQRSGEGQKRRQDRSIATP